MADITITTQSLDEGIVGRPYDQAVALSGAATLVTAHSISAGSLPPGLALDASVQSQRISGTPTTPGTYTFTLSVTDTAGAVTKQFTVQVNATAGDDERTGNVSVTESVQKRKLN